MPFTDAELAEQMATLLVDSGVMTNAEKNTLLEDPTEVNVNAALTQVQLNHFGDYWQALGAWMTNNGGNIATTTGLRVDGRTGGNPQGVGNRAIYNDAFSDVNAHIGGANFLRGKAVANQLRFISVMTE
jgi:hypothetical protein